MAEQKIGSQVESVWSEIERPGTGIDRTLIRNLLALTPSERLRVMVASARNLTELLAKARRV